MVKFKSDGQFLIEPDHPHYRVGGNYPFTVETTLKEKNGQNGYDPYLIVSNSHGSSFKVPLDEVPENYPLPTETVLCTIEDVRKGKLILSLNKDILK